MSLLSFHNVSTAYGHHPLLEQVSFGIEAGSVSCLIGRMAVASHVAQDCGGIVTRTPAKCAAKLVHASAYLSQEPELDEGGNGVRKRGRPASVSCVR